MNIHAVIPCRHTDRWTDVMKLVVAFCDFANVPLKFTSSYLCTSHLCLCMHAFTFVFRIPHVDCIKIKYIENKFPKKALFTTFKIFLLNPHTFCKIIKFHLAASLLFSLLTGGHELCYFVHRTFSHSAITILQVQLTL